MKNIQPIAVGILLSISVTSCNQQQTKATATNDSSAAKQSDTSSWKKLFNGQDLAGWHGFNKSGKVTNWIIEDSALVCLGHSESDYGGDIVTDDDYSDFELKWEWKIDKGSNSGVLYHVVEDKNYKGPFETGPEYQIIDDEGYPEKLEDWQKAGADYAMNLANDKKKLKPVGEWNTSGIVYNKGHVEHWLNGEKIVEFEVGTPEWEKEKAQGKWKDYPDYATKKEGRIALQDHGNKAYFRNIMIRKLN